MRRWIGKTARLQIVDDERGGWGNVGVDDIVFSDKPRVAAGPLQDEADFGTMGLALLAPEPGDVATTSLADAQLPQGIFTRSPAGSDAPAVKPFGQKLAGSLTRKLTLEPGQSATVTFLVTWHFPNLKLNEKFELTGRYYAQRFKSALAVAEHLAANFDTLCQQTRLWHDTWYDSTLPYWFLDRTFANTSILATSTCFRFGNGRFWGWEGVGCCAGTCGHVWHYAHAVGRLFPELERILRERVDFGVAQRDDGAILFRGEFNDFPAVDGQAGAILRAYREHQMSADDAFLRRVWPGVRKALEYLIREDANGDGLIEGKQHNTLDADWYGPVAWLSSLYLAALRAGEQMAREMGEEAFAEQCRQIFDKGRVAIVERLFDGEYFVNRADPKASRSDQLRHGLPYRPGVRAELGLPSGPGPRAAGEGNARRAAVAVALQLHARRRPVPRGEQARPLVRHARRRRLADVYFPARGLELRQGQGQRRRLGGRLFQRMHERLRVPGRRTHDLGGPVDRGLGDHPHGPRPLPRGAAESRGTKSNAATTTPARWPATACTWPPAATSTTDRKAT